MLTRSNVVDLAAYRARGTSGRARREDIRRDGFPRRRQTPLTPREIAHRERMLAHAIRTVTR